MPKISDNELSRVCIRLWTDDFEYLRRVSQSQGSLGLNLLVRQIIHTYVNNLKDAENQELDKLKNLGLAPLDPKDLIGIDELALEHKIRTEAEAEGIDLDLALEIEI